jgi:hypothetical protein
LAAGTGIVFVVLSVVAAIIAQPTGGQDAAEYFVERRSQVLVSSYLFGLAVVFFVWFLGSLRSQLRQAEGTTGRLSAVAFAGGILTASTLFFQGTLNIALAGGIAERVDPDITRALYQVSARAADLVPFWVAVLTGASAVVMLRTGIVPAWLGWFGGLVAVASLVVPVAIFVEGGPFASGGIYGFLVLGGFLLWTLVTSIVLVQRPGPTAA